MQPEHLEFSLSSLYNLFCKKNYWAPPQILQLYSKVMMLKFNDHINGFINYCRYHKKLSDKTISAYCIDLILSPFQIVTRKPTAVPTDISIKTVIYKSTAFRDQLGRRCYLLLMPISAIRFIMILCIVCKHCSRILTNLLICDILCM